MSASVLKREAFAYALCVLGALLVLCSVLGSAQLVRKCASLPLSLPARHVQGAIPGGTMVSALAAGACRGLRLSYLRLLSSRFLVFRAAAVLIRHRCCYRLQNRLRNPDDRRHDRCLYIGAAFCRRRQLAGAYGVLLPDAVAYAANLQTRRLVGINGHGFVPVGVFIF